MLAARPADRHRVPRYCRFLIALALAGLAAMSVTMMDVAAHAAATHSPTQGSARKSLRVHVASHGLYAATITVSARSAPVSGVELTIDRFARLIRLRGANHRLTLHLKLAVDVNHFTVRATGGDSALKLSVALRRIEALSSVSTAERAGTIAIVAAQQTHRYRSAGSGAGATGTTATTAPAPAGATGTTGATAPSTSSPSGTVTPPQPVGDPGAWSLIFDSEFAGTTLNSSDWQMGWPPSPGITADIYGTAARDCYNPVEDVVANGELDINLVAQPTVCDGVTEPYATGFISTYGTFSYTYGFAEARIWLPAAPNGSVADWPGFWAAGQDLNWPVSGEDDIAEGLSLPGNDTDGEPCYHFHYGTSRATAEDTGGCVAGSFTAGWHTFGADWEPGSVTYYYDGAKVGQLTAGITGDPMYLILDLLPSGVNGGQLVAPATLRVAYVRVWQH